MTIELINVTKKVRLGPIRTTYSDLNIRIEQKARMAFLAHKSAGIESILNLICASDAPDSGRILRSHSISWVIPDAGFIHKHLSLAAAARFIARLYEVDEAEYLAKVSQMADIGDAIDIRAERCPKDLQARFVFSLGVCLPFDQYIFGSLGGKADREQRAAILDELCQRSGILLITSDVKAAQQFCDQAYVFDGTGATYFDDMEAAAEFFSGVAGEDDVQADEFFDADPDLQDMVNMDI